MSVLNSLVVVGKLALKRLQAFEAFLGLGKVCRLAENIQTPARASQIFYPSHTLPCAVSFLREPKCSSLFT